MKRILVVEDEQAIAFGPRVDLESGVHAFGAAPLDGAPFDCAQGRQARAGTTPSAFP